MRKPARKKKGAKGGPGDPEMAATGPAVRKPCPQDPSALNKAEMVAGGLGLYKNSSNRNPKMKNPLYAAGRALLKRSDDYGSTMEPRQQMLTAAADPMHPPTPDQYQDIAQMPLQWPPPGPTEPHAPNSVNGIPDPSQCAAGCGDPALGGGNPILEQAGLAEKLSHYASCCKGGKKKKGAKGPRQGITELPLRKKASVGGGVAKRPSVADDALALLGGTGAGIGGVLGAGAGIGGVLGAAGAPQGYGYQGAARGALKGGGTGLGIGLGGAAGMLAADSLPPGTSPLAALGLAGTGAAAGGYLGHGIGSWLGGNPGMDEQREKEREAKTAMYRAGASLFTKAAGPFGLRGGRRGGMSGVYHPMQMGQPNAPGAGGPAMPNACGPAGCMPGQKPPMAQNNMMPNTTGPGGSLPPPPPAPAAQAGTAGAFAGKPATPPIDMSPGGNPGPKPSQAPLDRSQPGLAGPPPPPSPQTPPAQPTGAAGAIHANSAWGGKPPAGAGGASGNWSGWDVGKMVNEPGGIGADPASGGLAAGGKPPVEPKPSTPPIDMSPGGNPGPMPDRPPLDMSDKPSDPPVDMSPQIPEPPSTPMEPPGSTDPTFEARNRANVAQRLKEGPTVEGGPNLEPGEEAPNIVATTAQREPEEAPAGPQEDQGQKMQDQLASVTTGPKSESDMTFGERAQLPDHQITAPRPDEVKDPAPDPGAAGTASGSPGGAPASPGAPPASKYNANHGAYWNQINSMDPNERAAGGWVQTPGGGWGRMPAGMTFDGGAKQAAPQAPKTGWQGNIYTGPSGSRYTENEMPAQALAARERAYQATLGKQGAAQLFKAGAALLRKPR